MRPRFARSYGRPGDTAPQARSKPEGLVEGPGPDRFPCATIRLPAGPVADFALTTLANHPAGFVDRYLQDRYERLDPACDLATKSIPPFAAFGDRFAATPELGVALSESGGDYRLGRRLALAQHGPGSLESGLDAARRKTPGDKAGPEREIGFRTTARW